MLHDIFQVMILEVPILGTFRHIIGASSDWDDPTPPPMGPYPFLDASEHLYKRVCLSVHRSVSPSVTRSFQ